jgi:hypothetical protein
MFLIPFKNVTSQLLSTACWSSGLRSRLQNQRSPVQIPVVSRGFCDENYTCLQLMAVYIQRVRYIPYQAKTIKSAYK